MEEKIEGKLDLRFEQFGDFQTRLRTELLSYRPEEIAGWGKTERKSFIDDAIASAASYRPYLKEPIEQYLQREAEIERWIDKHQGLNSESAKKVLAEAFETDGHPVPANIVNQIKPQRIRDGIALIVSPAVFRELIVKDMVQEGTKVSDPARIEQELSGYAEMGFLLDPGGLTKDLGLPEGIKLVAVQNTYSARTLRHEESEILAQNIIDALENPQVRKLDNLAAKHISGENFDRDTVRQILSDLAARVEEGALPDNLGGLGLTKEYAESHRQEAELVKTVWQKVSTAAKDESKETLANKIRGGLLVPENILINLGGNSGVGLLKGVEVKDNDFGLCLRSFKEGRFVYFRPTLKQGDELVHNNITYRIEDLISQGAQGVVYKAAAGGEVFAVKELFFPLATAATDPKLSPFFIDGLWKSQLSPTDLKKPFDEMIKQVDLYRFFKDLGDFADGLNGYEDSGNMGTEFRIKLDQLLAPRLGQVKTRDGIPIYKSGAMELVRFHPQQGGKVGLSPGQQKLILEETAAAAKQALAEIAGSTKGRALAQELTEAQERFIAESETLFGLADVEGVAGSRGIKIGGAVDPEDPGWQAVYMIQQWVEGQTLGKALALSEDTPKIWEYQKSVDFVRELLRTLRTLHQRKVIHKDLKPGNIMVDAKGQPVLVDFGIAKGRVASLSRSLRAGTTLVGTPGFAPEDLVTTGADARSDIYSLGMVLFTMLTGRDPSYQSGNPKDDVPVDPIMGEARLKKVAELLRRERDPSGNQKIPEALVSIVLKTVAPKPEDRFQTAEEMDGALSEIRIVSEDQHLDNLFKALDKQYQLPFYSRYPDGEQASGIMRRRSGGGIMIHGSFVDDLGREIGFHYDDDKIAPWPAEIKEYLAGIEKVVIQSPHRIPEMLTRLADYTCFNYGNPWLGKVAYIGGRDLMIKILQDVVSKNEPVSSSWLDLTEKVILSCPNGVEQQIEYAPILRTVALKDSDRRGEVINRCFELRSTPVYSSLVPVAVEAIKRNLVGKKPVPDLWLDLVEEMIKNHPYDQLFYSRYPDGEQASGIMRRRSGGGIMIHGSFVDDLGREIEFHYDDDKIAPWPAEIKEYVEVVKKMAGDSTQLPKVLERIRNWSNWSLKQSTYPTFWRALSEQLTEELKPKSRTVVSP